MDQCLTTRERRKFGLEIPHTRSIALNHDAILQGPEYLWGIQRWENLRGIALAQASGERRSLFAWYPAVRLVMGHKKRAMMSLGRFEAMHLGKVRGLVRPLAQAAGFGVAKLAMAAIVPLFGSAMLMFLVVAVHGMKLLMSIMVPAVSGALRAFTLTQGNRLAGLQAQTDCDPVDNEFTDAHIVKAYVVA